MPDLCTTIHTPHKGIGVFTLQPIKPGTVLLHDKPILRLQRGTHDITPSQVIIALSNLSKQDRATFLSLHENNLPYASREMRIYKSNCFGDAETSWLSLKFSRVNHSCAPNAEITEIDSPDGAKIVAVKTIAKGEEVCICYLGPGEDGRREVRRRMLKGTYGFDCDCCACGLRGKEAWMSDVRRGCIAVLAGRQMGIENSDLERVDGINGVMTTTTTAAPTKDVNLAAPFGYSHRRLKTPLTTKQKVQTNVLLALLLEAEGLVNYRLAQAWVHATVALMAQMQDLKPLVVLPAAKFLRQWLERAVEVMGSVRREDSRDFSELRGAVAVLTGCSYMKAAGEAVRKSGKRKNGEVDGRGVNGKKMRKKSGMNGRLKKDGCGEEMFATVFGETHSRLTRKESVEYVRTMKGGKKMTVGIVIESCDD